MNCTTIDDSSVDVLVLGAGPGGLSCALVCADRHRSATVRVIDAGRHHSRRSCPADHGRNCLGCGERCNVIAGFGGSLHYGDAVKLSRFPSGRRLQELLGTENAELRMDQAVAMVLGPIASAFVTPAVADVPFPLKTYPVMSLSAAEVRASVERLHAAVGCRNNLELDLNTKAVAIDPASGGGFDVRCVRPKSAGREHCVHARRVVVAVGRFGFLWWRQELRRLGVRHTRPAASIGLRFDCPSDALRAAALRHPDFKTTLHHRGRKFKTFCFCAGPSGGRIKLTDYGPFTLLDGHISVEANARPGANFAILSQLTDEAGRPRPFEWIDRQVLQPYIRLNAPHPGKPVAQWYPDFRDHETRVRSADELARTRGLSLPIADLAISDVAALLDADTHTGFVNVFESLFGWFAQAGGSACCCDPERVAVLALELEGLWDELLLAPTMESSVPGIFVVGDCAGIAQGILQAAAAGIEAGHTCLS